MRLVPIPPAELSDAQRQLFDSIVAFTKAQNPKFAIADEQGALVGPFNAMLHFPQFGNAAWGVNLALSKNTTLPKPVHELIILVTGARFTSRYEIYAHELVADKAGLSQAKIASLAAGGRPSDLNEQEGPAFGEQGVAEMIYLVGFYCLISVLLNGYDAAVPGRAEVR